MDKKVSNFFERINQIIDYYDIKSVRDFAINYLGYDSSEKINRLKGERTSPSYEILQDITNKFDKIDANWLLTGNGSMTKENNAEIKSVKEIGFSISQFKQRGYAPYYSDLLVSAGQFDLMSIEQREEPESWIKFPGIEVDGWFPIIGCSMEPKVYAGDIVGVRQLDGWERLDPDKTYLIITRDDRMIKHLETDDENKDILWAVSENYRRFKLEKTEIIQIFRVVWAGRLV